jgi:hypothetical protein
VPVLAGLLALTAFLTENAGEAWSALTSSAIWAATGQGSYGPALMAVAMGLGRLAGQAMAARVADRALLRGGLIVAAAGRGGGGGGAGGDCGLCGLHADGAWHLGRGADRAGRGRAAGRARGAQPRHRAHHGAGLSGLLPGPAVLGFVAEMAGLRASYGLVAALLLAGLALQMRLGAARPLTEARAACGALMAARPGFSCGKGGMGWQR